MAGSGRGDGYSGIRRSRNHGSQCPTPCLPRSSRICQWTGSELPIGRFLVNVKIYPVVLLWEIIGLFSVAPISMGFAFSWRCIYEFARVASEEHYHFLVLTERVSGTSTKCPVVALLGRKHPRFLTRALVLGTVKV